MDPDWSVYQLRPYALSRGCGSKGEDGSEVFTPLVQFRIHKHRLTKQPVDLAMIKGFLP
jgi:hypothetical protein